MNEGPRSRVLNLRSEVRVYEALSWWFDWLAGGREGHRDWTVVWGGAVRRALATQKSPGHSLESENHLTKFLKLIDVFTPGSQPIIEHLTKGSSGYCFCSRTY